MANEPYQRVARDNGVYEGAMIGGAVAAGGAGAGIFGARMSYNGIEKKANRAISEMDSALSNLADKETSKIGKYNKKMSKIINKEKPSNQAKIDKSLNRLESRHQKNLSKIRGQADKLADSYAEVSRPDYVPNKQAAHAYSKMGGGWKKAGIIGASAVIGSGIGMGIDAMKK